MPAIGITGEDHGRVRVGASVVVLLALMSLCLVVIGARSASASLSSGCLSSGYDCVEGGYNATTMNNNWATSYYGDAAAGGIGTPPHNCTLYAAWVLAQNGLADPKVSWGNAKDWGRSLASVTNSTPAVGSIAWYDAGRSGVGSFGHVAYVAQVNSANGTVFLESDNYIGGSAGYTSNGWVAASDPSGYIHLKDGGGQPDGSLITTDRSFPDGAIIRDPATTGLYVALGGSLFWYAWDNDKSPAASTTRSLYQTQRDNLQMKGWIYNVATSVIHGREANYPARHRLPDDGSVFYERGNTQQYFMRYRYAAKIGAAEVGPLGATNRAIMIPTGNVGYFRNTAPAMPADELFKTVDAPRVSHVVNGRAYWATTDTVVSCVSLVKDGGRGVSLVPNEIRTALTAAGNWLTTPTACSFPSDWVLNGPGGFEQWRIEGAGGTGGYTRRYYPSALAVYLNTSGVPHYATLLTVGALNNLPQGPSMNIPNGIFFRDAGSGQVFKAESAVFRPVPSPAVLSCLGNPAVVAVPSNAMVGIPQGPAMTCTFDNRVLVRPDGRAYFVKDGLSHPIGNPAVRDCIVVRRGTGAPISTSDGVVDSYAGSTAGYCPYELEVGLYFVKEANDPTIWFIEPGGVKRHVGSLCVSDPFTTAWKQYHVWTVPNGETAGQVQGADWFASGPACAALTPVWQP